jgi:hypothetical protein
LASLDSSSYSDAWKGAAITMHSCVTLADFDNGMESLRGLFGKVQSRDIKSKRHLTGLLGLPDGDFWVISHAVRLQNMPNVAESLVRA